MASIVEAEHPKQELYLLNRRDEEEKERLDQQSNLIRIIKHGHVLDPRIPKQNISRVADVATGTGVWLREVAAELADGENGSPLETVGFDISADQFPKSPAPRTKFVVWDMTTSFPEEYHSSFDVVHIRLVVPAIRAEQIKDVVKNLVELLRPGGYLQWTDAFDDGMELTHRDDDGEPPCKYEEELFSRFHAERGYSFHILGDVKNALQFLPVEDIHVTDDTDAAYWRPEIRGMVTQWQARAMSLWLEMILTQQGQGKEQAKMAADAYQKKAIEMGKRGTIFKTLIMTLVARKKI